MPEHRQAGRSRMHARVPHAPPWTLGAVFAFIAAALVAVFGITPAHAASTARHATGPAPAETQTATWVAPVHEVSITTAAADQGEDHAKTQPSAVGPAQARPTGPTLGFAVPHRSPTRPSGARPAE